MSALRPRGIPVMLGGVERHFLFTLNLIDEVQEATGKSIHNIMQELTDDDISNHALRDLVVVLINDEACRARRNGEEAQTVTAFDVGEMIGLDNYGEVMAAVLRAYGVSVPEAEEDAPN